MVTTSAHSRRLLGSLLAHQDSSCSLLSHLYWTSSSVKCSGLPKIKLTTIALDLILRSEVQCGINDIVFGTYFAVSNSTTWYFVMLTGTNLRLNFHWGVRRWCFNYGFWWIMGCFTEHWSSTNSEQCLKTIPTYK